jgi:phycobilisome core-membrane linker protein
MLNSNEYATAFGEDTVPYERFITPTDLNTRRVPALKRELDASAVDLRPGSRPDVPVPADFRFSGELTARNLSGRGAPIRGGWSVQLAGGDQGFSTSQPGVPQGPGSIQADPEPSRRWSAPRWQPGGGVTALWSSGVSGSWSATTTAPGAAPRSTRRSEPVMSRSAGPDRA